MSARRSQAFPPWAVSWWGGALARRWSQATLLEAQALVIAAVKKDPQLACFQRRKTQDMESHFRADTGRISGNGPRGAKRSLAAYAESFQTQLCR
jgi:hypothetical protein